MNLKQRLLFVIFPDDFFESIESRNELYIFLKLEQLLRNNDFKEDTSKSILEHCIPIESEKIFIDLQLKFFLMRNSFDSQNDLGELIGGVDTKRHQ
jgi:hypothetical protein